MRWRLEQNLMWVETDADASRQIWEQPIDEDGKPAFRDVSTPPRLAPHERESYSLLKAWMHDR